MEKNWLDLADRAGTWIRAHRSEYLLELKDLVSIPSVSRPDLSSPGAPFGPDCARVLHHALSRGAAYGFNTENLDGYAGIISMGDRTNAIGIFAHLDVVPVGDGWIYPPFDATYLPEHQAVIGRGVSDNKGSAVMGLFAMRMLREWQLPLSHGVCLYLGTSEENGMQDMQALKDRGHVFPRFSLVPDSRFPVNFGQKGTVRGFIHAPAQGNLLAFDAGSAFNVVPDRAECLLDSRDEEAVQNAYERLPAALRGRIALTLEPDGVRLTATGLAGHAAHPQGSVNAIHLLCAALWEMQILTGSCREAVHALFRLTQDDALRRAGVACEDAASGPLTLVYSMAHLNQGVLAVGLDARFPISVDADQLTSRLRAVWAQLGYSATDLKVTRPFYIPVDDPRAMALQAVYAALSGRDDPPYAMGGGTYSRVVPNAITYGARVPGPDRRSDFLPEGHGENHGRDEALLMEDMELCTAIYAVAITALDALLASSCQTDKGTAVHEMTPDQNHFR